MGAIGVYSAKPKDLLPIVDKLTAALNIPSEAVQRCAGGGRGAGGGGEVRGRHSRRGRGRGSCPTAVALVPPFSGEEKGGGGNRVPYWVWLRPISWIGGALNHNSTLWVRAVP